MSATSASLLERLRERPDAATWQRLVDVYTPFIRGWLARYALQPQDIDDVAQEVLAVVVRELPRFHYDKQRGSFRGWLRSIMVNRLRAFRRTRKGQPIATGDSDFAQQLQELEDACSGISRIWDREHDRHVVRSLLELIRCEFEPATWRAFELFMLRGLKAAEVAAQLGMTANAVFIAKSRVLRCLKREVHGLVDVVEFR